MKTLIVTVAGTATRFNRDTELPTLKCLYNKGGYKNTLLYQILDKARDIDEYIIVGGYLFEHLQDFINEYLSEFKSKIKLVKNYEYDTYGSGFSLIMGIDSASLDTDEIIFVEGDLYFDKSDFDRVKNSKRNVFTVNRELITAKKAVVVYENENHFLRYMYDTTHKYLSIDEPFLAVYNSGQIWKFIDTEKLRRVLVSLTPAQEEGTNLEIIQGYFGDLTKEEYEMVEFGIWHNCNTVKDYETVYEKINR